MHDLGLTQDEINHEVLSEVAHEIRYELADFEKLQADYKNRRRTAVREIAGYLDVGIVHASRRGARFAHRISNGHSPLRVRELTFTGRPSPSWGRAVRRLFYRWLVPFQKRFIRD
jgi:hypothetical protein